MAEWRMLLEQALEALKRTPPVLRLEGKRFLLVGDTHGFPEVSEWALKLGEDEGYDYVVFLGDYVDRGPRGVENLELLLAQIVSRDNVVLLRGNHESLFMNYYYGFREEAERKRNEDYLSLVEEVYRNMPFIALLPDGVMTVHGGVPCKVCSYRPEEPIGINEIETRLGEIKGSEEAAEPSDKIAMQLLWNDPRGTIEWFMPSPRGPGIYLYGREAWRRFMEANGLRLIVRAHEAVDGAHVWLRDGSQLRPADGDSIKLADIEYGVVTVFSSLYHGQSAAVLGLDAAEGVVKVFLYKGSVSG